MRSLAVVMAVFLASSLSAQTVNLLTESFENGGSIPAGWATDLVNGSNYLSFVSTSSSPAVAAAANGTYFVKFNSFSASTGVTNRLKKTASMSTVGKQNVTVSFSWYEDPGYSSSSDKVVVEWSTDGTSWTEAGSFNRYNATAGWKEKSVVLPAGAGNIPALYVAFKFVSAWGNNCSFDYARVDAEPNPVGATVGGIVTNGISGLPIIGAMVNINDSIAYTDFAGHYTIQANNGTRPVLVSKLGFDNYSSTVVIAGNNNALNFQLFENTAAPSALLAVANGANTAVNLTWGIPQSPYEIIYDDATFENITSWSSAGNINALKFTPIAQYPVSITGGRVNIGDGSYPAGGNPLVAFEMAVYDDDGALGYPGTELARVEVTPTATGWVDFTFDAPVVINSGNFYLGMIQGGNYPNCAPIAVDETNPSMRSYSKFASGNGPWVPAGYNDFMIRAYCIGAGGPLDMATAAQPLYVAKSNVNKHSLSLKEAATTAGLEREGIYNPLVTESPNAPGALLGYEVYRLLEPNQGNPATYTLLNNNVTGTSYSDITWGSLPNGAYKWAVRAKYSNNRFSAYTLSNTLGKGWESTVTFNITVSSATGNALGTQISMTYLTVPGATQYDEIGTTPENGTLTFNNVWKGNYSLVIKKFNYEQIGPITITIDDDVEVFNYTLMETRHAPTNLYVDDRTLVATWNAPKPETAIFEEPWDGHTFATQGWTTDASNWNISTPGNPGVSAEFNYAPAVTNYESHLTSPEITGVGSPYLYLRYDISLNNYGTTNENQMAVEIWDGANWNRLKNYTNMGGDIAWTSESLDITTYTWDTFKFRFTAYGVDSNDIDNWNIDNVAVVATLTAGKGLLGYNLYLDDTQIAFTTETTYQIPQSLCTYGQSYTASVDAAYESGVSARDYYTFTAHYLPAPRNLAAAPIQSSVYLIWEEPIMPGKSAQVGHPNLPTNSFGENANGASNFVPTAQYTPSNTDAILWDNGTIINSPGTGAGGADESVIPAGGSSYGFGMNQGAGYSVADDFTVGTNWTVNSITFQGYQTNSGNTSTFTGLYFRIYNGDPSAGGTVVFGDLTTNRMTSTNFSGIYRVNAPGEGTARPVMNIVCDGLNISLAPGTYWIEWAATGSLASGPWIPNTAAAVGNSIQNQAGPWAGLVNPGAVDLPFIISGSGGGAGAAPDVLAYNIYRDGTLIATVDGDIYEYYDLFLDPAEYCYTVTAVYDLEQFGFPAGSTDESLEEGPACVNVDYGTPIPWTEDWSSTNFTLNSWDNGSNRWRITNAVGNAVPAAEFNWATNNGPETNYSYALESTALLATVFDCSKIWLDFDLKLDDRNATGNEKLKVEVFIGGSWKKVAEYKNEGSFTWSTKHIEISSAAGKSLKVRFLAYGENTADMIAWYVDNVKVYPEPKPATDLTLNPDMVNETTYNNILNWNAPDCTTGPSGSLKKLFQHDSNPANGYYQAFNRAYGVVYDLTAYPDATLAKIDFHHASWGTTGIWEYKVHVVDWTTYAEIATIGPLNTTGDDKWENDIELGDIMGFGGGQIGIMLEPMGNTASDAYPDFSADNVGPDGVSVFGDLPDYSGFAASGIGDFLQNLWIYTALDGKQMVSPAKVPVSQLNLNSVARNASMATANNGSLTLNQKVKDMSVLMANRGVVGYNVYQGDVLVTPTPVTSTSFTHVVTAPFTNYCYTVKAVHAAFDNATMESVATAEACADPTGITPATAEGIKVYPNPASSFVNVTTTSETRQIVLVNYLGQVVRNVTVSGAETLKLDVSSYESGIYFVKFIAQDGSESVERITVTR
jgi:hypothetical protein